MNPLLAAAWRVTAPSVAPGVELRKHRDPPAWLLGSCLLFYPEALHIPKRSHRIRHSALLLDDIPIILILGVGYS
jgi:hypothetical protein